MGAKSEETKQKIREGNLNKEISCETKNKISKAQIGEKNHFFGKTHSEETRQKMRDKWDERKKLPEYWLKKKI